MVSGLNSNWYWLLEGGGRGGRGKSRSGGGSGFDSEVDCLKKPSKPFGTLLGGSLEEEGEGVDSHRRDDEASARRRVGRASWRPANSARSMAVWMTSAVCLLHFTRTFAHRAQRA